VSYNNLDECNFNIKYYDYSLNEEKIFSCKESAIPSGYCIFHDKDYYKRSPDVIKTELKRKIKESVECKKALFCIGYHLSSVTVKETFTEPVYFNSAKFHAVNFTKATFFNSVDFSKAEYYDDVYFYTTRFLDFANFTLAKFNNRIIFSDAIFTNVIFLGSSFENVTFSNTNFGLADFSKAEFNSYTNFVGAIFAKRAKFIGTIFFDRVDFTAAEFHSGANFIFAIFDGGNKTLFTIEDISKVSFQNSDISKITLNANLFFNKGKDKFKIFDETLLEWNMYQIFTWDIFPNEKESIKLKKFLKFLDEEWIEDVEFVKVNETTISVREKEKNPNDIYYYDSANLRMILIDKKGSFTYLSSIHDLKLILDVNQNTVRLFIDGREEYNFETQKIDGKMKVFSEQCLLNSVITVYRFLRENFEYNLRYDEAGDLFIREMELKRNYKQINESPGYKIIKKDIISRNISLTGLYYNFFKYGESLLRPLLFLIFPLFILGTIAHILLNYQTFIENSFAITFNAAQLTLLDILQLPNENQKTLLDDFIKIISLPVLGSLFIPLRRKFERKFRH
jgi:uncharacterized protein YjbI with pentapeptide repeats